MVNYPNDWVKSTIGECVDIYQGGTPSTTNSAYWGGDIVWLTPGEITKLTTLYVNNSERKITQEGLNNSSATLLPAGTILLCTRATIGNLAIASKPVTTNQGFKNLICKDCIDNKFFAYLLTTYKDKMLSKAIGTTFLEISKKELSKLTVYLPPSIHEQRAIAETLTAFDDYIADLAALMEKKKAIRDGALEDLVSGRTRINGNECVWAQKELRQIASYKRERTITEKRFYVSTENINQDFSGIMPYTSVDEVAGIAFSSGDILMANIRPYLKKIWYADFPGGCSADVLVIHSDTISSKLLYYILANNKFINYIMTGGVKGIKMPRGDKKYIMRYPILIPEKASEQEEIGDILTAMDDEITSLEAERDKMIQVREGAMNDLLTGRVRLKV